MSTIRYGIIGCGVIGPVHAHAISQLPGATLHGLCDILPERAQSLAEAYQTPLITTDYHKLIASPDIDAICVCTPHYLHAEMAIAAAQAGKHVFCEKPMALNTSDMDAMINAADDAGVQLGICFQHRFDPKVNAIKAMIDRGDFGAMLLGGAHCICLRDESYYQSETWRGTWSREGGGVLVNQAIHTIDLLIYLLGAPQSITGMHATRRWQGTIEVEDTATAMLTFPNGAQGHIIASSASHLDWHTRLSVYGFNGSAEITSGSLEDRAVVKIGTDAPREIAGDECAPAVGKACYGNSHINALDAFTRALLDGHQFPVSGREGRVAAEVVQAIYRSAQTQRPVNLTRQPILR